MRYFLAAIITVLAAAQAEAQCPGGKCAVYYPQAHAAPVYSGYHAAPRLKLFKGRFFGRCR